MIASASNDLNHSGNQDAVVWVRTADGQVEARARAVVKDRPLRHLLMAVDGVSQQDRLRSSLKGLAAATPSDFDTLRGLGLIEPTRPRTPTPAAAPVNLPLEPLSYSELSAALTRQIVSEFGLMGLKMSLAVERAQTLQELIDIKERLLGRIRNEHGAEARRLAELRLTAKPVLNPDRAEIETPESAEQRAPMQLKPLEFSDLSAALTRIISHEFGLRGIWLTLAIERAKSFEDLKGLAKDVIARVERESGPLQAADVARELDGIEVLEPTTATIA